MALKLKRDPPKPSLGGMRAATPGLRALPSSASFLEFPTDAQLGVFRLEWELFVQLEDQ
ncbi:MAG: hypothetical protein R2724_21560 [Bryobacterales bacterium]